MAVEYDPRRPRLPKGLAEKVDTRRGQVPFNRFVVEALEEALNGSAQASEAGIGRGSADTDGSRQAAPPRAPSGPTQREIMLERQRRVNEGRS